MLQQVKCWACKAVLEVPESWAKNAYLAHHIHEQHPGWPGVLEDESIIEHKHLRAALASIAYLDYSHLSPDEQVVLYKKWARMALDGIKGEWTVIESPEFKKQWAELTADIELDRTE